MFQPTKRACHCKRYLHHQEGLCHEPWRGLLCTYAVGDLITGQQMCRCGIVVRTGIGCKHPLAHSLAFWFASCGIVMHILSTLAHQYQMRDRTAREKAYFGYSTSTTAAERGEKEVSLRLKW